MTVNYDSILTASDSNVLTRSEFYQEGVVLPDHTVGMQERPYSVRSDDWAVAGMAAMFCILAVVLYKSRQSVVYRIKDFFTTKRLYAELQTGDNASEGVMVTLLTAVSALCLSVIYFDDLAGLPVSYLPASMPYLLFAAGFAVLLVWVYAKAGIYSLVNWVFFDGESNRRWMSGYLLATSLLAFPLYPVALVDVFFHSCHEMVAMCAILVVILYELLLFFKLFVNFKAKKYGYLLIFLYFCSVELLPALVLWHLAAGISYNVIVKI